MSSVMSDGEDFMRGGGEDDRKARGREAAKRSREKKKQQFMSLADENEKLRKENEYLREKVQRTNVSVLVNSECQFIRTAVDYFNQNLPDLIFQSIKNVINVKKQTSATVGRLIAELHQVVPPTALIEINAWVLKTWLRVKKSGTVPTDPILKAIYDIDGPLFQNATPEQTQKWMSHIEGVLERLTLLSQDCRQLRRLVDEVQTIGQRLEVEGPWFAELHDTCLGIWSADQIAAYYRWFELHMPVLQEAVVGKRFSLSGSAAAISAGWLQDPSAAPLADVKPPTPVPAAATTPPLAPPLAPPLVPPPPPMVYPARPEGCVGPPGSGIATVTKFISNASAMVTSAASSAAAAAVQREAAASPSPVDRKRPAEEPVQAARPAPAAAPAGAARAAPAGAGIDPDLLRELIRDAVSREIQHFFLPANGQGHGHGHGEPTFSSAAATATPPLTGVGSPDSGSHITSGTTPDLSPALDAMHGVEGLAAAPAPAPPGAGEVAPGALPDVFSPLSPESFLASLVGPEGAPYGPLDDGVARATIDLQLGLGVQ